MIKAATIFVSPTPAKPTASPAKPVSRSTEPTPCGETPKNDHLPEPKKWNDGEGLNCTEEPKRDPQNTSRQTQTSEPTVSSEEKTSEAQTNDTTDFQQLITVAMSDLTGECPAETTVETVQGDVLPGNTETAAVPVVPPVNVETVTGEGSSVDMPVTSPVPSIPVPVEPVEIPTPAVMIPTPVVMIPTPAVAPQTPAADTAVAEESTQAMPKPTIASPAPDAVVPLPGEKNELPLPTEHTSGRPESMPIKADVPQAEIPRINVEAPDSSTVAKTAASEINPNSGDSGTMTPGRPVVPFIPSDSPKADPPVTNTVTTIQPDASAAGEKQTDAQSSSDGSSDPAPAKDPFADGKPKAAQATTTPNVSQKVATVADSSTAQGRDSRVETMMGPWADTAPTTTVTPSNDVAAVSATNGAKLTEQITTHIQTRRDDLGEEMVIRLDPPELGKVHIQFRSQNGELTGVIRADNPQTHAELQREASSLIQRLNEAGVQIKTLDLQMGDTGQQGRGEQSFAQAQNAYSMFQQQNGNGRGYGYNHAAPDVSNSLMQDDPEAWNSQNGQYVSDSALNVML